MPSPVNQSAIVPSHSQGMRGHENKGGQSDSALENSVRVNDDSARISEAAKNLHQVGEGNRSSLTGEQAQQFAMDISAMFQANPQQAIASQASNLDAQLRELLQQSA